MNDLIKQISKKALSLLLVLCLVLTTMAATFSVLALDSVYTVTQESPAIPMNVLTSVDTKDLLIEIGEETVDGSLVEFESIGDFDGVKYNATTKSFNAYSKGAYGFVAKYQGVEQIVYVVVKNANDTEWVLYETDFTEGDAKDLEGWSVYTKLNNAAWVKSESINNDFDVIENIGDGRFRYTGARKGIALTINSGAGTEWGSSGALVLNNETVKAFSDYKITATVHGKCSLHSNTGGFGLFGRGELSGEATAAALNFDTLIYNINATNSTANVNNTVFNGNKLSAQEHTSGYLYNSSKPVDLKYVFSGNTLTFTAGSGDAVVDEENTAKAGVVGVFSSLYEDAYFAVVEKFRVALNNTADDIPVSKELNLFCVSKSAPAIPMNTFTGVNTGDFLIEIGDNTVNGSLVTFEPAGQFSGAEYDTVSKTFKAYNEGTYKFVAKYQDVEQVVYVVVKKPDDTEWILYKTDFTDGSASYNDWVASFYNNNAIQGVFSNQKNYIDEIKQNGGNCANFSGYFPYALYKLDSGKYAVDHNGVTDGLNWCTNAYFYCVNDIFNHFSDYTVDASYQSTSSYHNGHSVLGRINIDSDGVGYTKGVGISIRNNFGNADKGQIRLYDNSLQSANLSDVSGAAAAFSRTANNTQVYSVNVKSKYAANNMTTTVSVPNDNYTQTFQTTVSETGKGAIGFNIEILCEETGMGRIQSYSDITVTLNNDPANPSDYPAYSKIELFSVKNSSPAIPMFEMKSLDLSEILVEFSNATVSGALVNWSVLDGAEGLEIKNNNTLNAYKAGTYRVSAKHGEEEKTVYVIVNKEGNTDWVLYETDFTMGDNKDFEGWSVYTKKSNNSNWIKAEGLPNKFELISKVGDGRYVYTGGEVGLALTQESGEGLAWGSSGALVLDNEIVKSFSDYTITASIWGKNGIHSDPQGFGIYGRAVFDDESVANETVKFSTLLYNHVILNEGNASKIINCSYNGKKRATSVNTDYTFKNASPLDFKYVYSGDMLTFSTDTCEEVSVENKAAKGVVGVFSDLYEDAYYAVVRTFKVSLNVPVMPKLSNIIYGKDLYVKKYSTVDFNNLQFNIDGNTFYGSELTFVGVESNSKLEFIKTKKTASVFELGTYTLNVNYAGKTIGINLICTDDSTADYVYSKSFLSVNGNGNATVTRDLSKQGKYTVTLMPDANHKAELLSLKSGENALLTPSDSTGLKYEITVQDACELNLTVNFIPDGNYFDTKCLGATLNYLKSGIKFGFRTSNIVMSQSDNEIGVYKDTIEVAGVQYNITGMGALVIPSVLLEQNEELTVDTKSVINHSFKYVSCTTYNFSDVTFTLTNIPENMHSLDISTRTYLEYDDNGTKKYIYGDSTIRSYNNVHEAIMKNIVPDKLLVNGKTNNEADDDSSTTNTSYTSNQTVIFNVDTMYGNSHIQGINLKWNYYELDADGANITKSAQGESNCVAGQPMEIKFMPEVSDDEGRYILLKVEPFNNENTPYIDCEAMYCYAIVNGDKITNQEILGADYQFALEKIKEMVKKASSQKKINPEPDKSREEWLSLNGKWEFSFDKPVYDQTIEVPFSWTSPLSTVKKTDKTNGYYRVTSDWNPEGERIFLVFGAVDYDSKITVNGQLLGTHRGGYDKFEVDVTNVWKRGAINTIEVEVEDLSSGEQLTGKQYYGTAKGIWQTARLEARPDAYITDYFVTTTMDGTVTYEIEANNAEGATVSFPTASLKLVDDSVDDVAFDSTAKIVNGKARLSFKVDNPKLWSPEEPYLYYGDLVLSINNCEDRISTYFGVREIGTERFDGNSIKYITLNGKPYFINGVLDQSYNPQGYFTLPTDDDCKQEIQRLKDIGINMTRIHIKAEEPLKLYYADKLGMLVMEDIPCFWGNPTENAMAQYEKEMEAQIIRDRNHPSIFYWVIFNETWGLFTTSTDADGNEQKVYKKETADWVVKCFNRAKELDPTRLVEDNSPCNQDHTVTDVNTWHFYSNGYENVKKVINNFCKGAYVGSQSNYMSGYTMDDVPCMNSECGNVWGVDGTIGESDISWQYKYMINEFRLQEKLCGYVFTQFHDVTNEWNGYYTIDNYLKDFGYEKYGSSLNDLHSQDYVGADYAPMSTVNPGETLSIPMFISSFTDVRHDKELTLKFNLKLENPIDGDTDNAVSIADRSVTISEYGTTTLDALSITVPQHDGVAVLSWTLYDGEQKVMSNYMLFDVVSQRSDVLTIDVNNLTASGFTSEKVEGSHIVKAINKDNAGDYQKISGIGNGSFSATVKLSDIPSYDANSDVRLMLEASTRFAMAHDYPDNVAPDGGEQDYVRGYTVDPGTNPNTFKQTSGEKNSGKLKVLINGTEIGTVTLDDCPADSRGSLSHLYQPTTKQLSEVGSYGQLIDMTISKEDIAKLVGNSDSFTVTFQNEGDCGLSIFDRYSGQYGIGVTFMAK